MNEWIIRIVDVGYKLEKDIYIFIKNPNGDTEMLDGTIFPLGHGNKVKPTLSLTNGQMIAFAKALNKEGVNPEKEYTVGKLEATEKHLKDMRKLVLKKQI